MPSIEHSKIIQPGWEKSARHLWGIPLYPSGEMDAIEYIMEDPSNMSEMQKRLYGFYFQLVPNIFILYMFCSNHVEALKLIKHRPKTMSSCLCTIPAFLGVMFGLCVVLSMLSVGINCRIYAWYANVCLLVSAVCNSSIVLQKAYIVQNRNFWILAVGIGFMLPQLGYVYYAWVYSIMTLDPSLGCVFNYPTFLPYYWFGAEMPLNFFFSLLFARVAYKQYHMFGSKAWKRLARDGIQIMILAVLCNIICVIMIVLEVGGDFSQMFFLANWLITSKLLISHCHKMRLVKK